MPQIHPCKLRFHRLCAAIHQAHDIVRDSFNLILYRTFVNRTLNGLIETPPYSAIDSLDRSNVARQKLFGSLDATAMIGKASIHISCSHDIGGPADQTCAFHGHLPPAHVPLPSPPPKKISSWTWTLVRVRAMFI